MIAKALLTSAAGTNAQTACINTAITSITYATTGAMGATITGLQTGVSGSFSGTAGSGTVTISGTPSVDGSFPYTVTLTGGPCGGVTAAGTITVNNITGGTVAADQTICSAGDPAAFTQTVACTAKRCIILPVAKQYNRLYNWLCQYCLCNRCKPMMLHQD
ncbi:MAG: hypothetical protein IPO92_06555 [Saprospiraceae bacterium]|nr:hypothetical protein [Saprospiraceae bacterium]